MAFKPGENSARRKHGECRIRDYIRVVILALEAKGISPTRANVARELVQIYTSHFSDYGKTKAQVGFHLSTYFRKCGSSSRSSVWSVKPNDVDFIAPNDSTVDAYNPPEPTRPSQDPPLPHGPIPALPVPFPSSKRPLNISPAADDKTARPNLPLSTDSSGHRQPPDHDTTEPPTNSLHDCEGVVQANVPCIYRQAPEPAWNTLMTGSLSTGRQPALERYGQVMNRAGDIHSDEALPLYLDRLTASKIITQNREVPRPHTYQERIQLGSRQAHFSSAWGASYQENSPSLDAGPLRDFVSWGRDDRQSLLNVSPYPAQHTHPVASPSFARGHQQPSQASWSLPSHATMLNVSQQSDSPDIPRHMDTREGSLVPHIVLVPAYQNSATHGDGPRRMDFRAGARQTEPLGRPPRPDISSSHRYTTPLPFIPWLSDSLPQDQEAADQSYL